MEIKQILFILYALILVFAIMQLASGSIGFFVLNCILIVFVIALETLEKRSGGILTRDKSK
jgi:hypothetical protein